ncbi:hypothetical protein SISSUDRAFT_959618, partial [Sistotremastrum suecicum HHB10207 ss-3]
LLDPLNRLQNLTQKLFQSLSPPSTKPPPPPPIESFLDCEVVLSEALHVARQHQIKQRRIEELKAEVLDQESKLREIWQELETGRRELGKILAEADQRLETIEKAKAAAIPYPELLAYASTLSAFTSAPPNMPDLSLPGQPPPPLFFPPFPNEEKMRKGHLNTLDPLGKPGETHPVGQAPSAPSPTDGRGGRDILQQYHMNEYAGHELPGQPFNGLDLDLNPDL